MIRSRRALLDPFFLGCCAFYAANRWLVKPHHHTGWFHSWFDDFLLIPCALPPLLLLHEWLSLRRRGGPPRWGEIAAHLAGWSLLCEFVGPRFLHRGTADPLDVLAYAAGAVIAGCWWQRSRENHAARAPLRDGAARC